MQTKVTPVRQPCQALVDGRDARCQRRRPGEALGRGPHAAGLLRGWSPGQQAQQQHTPRRPPPVQQLQAVLDPALGFGGLGH